MIIDPTSSIGKVRLRVADYSDFPIFPDSVYHATLSDCNDNVVKASGVMARYILGALAHKTHRKMLALEVWGSEAFKNYKEFLILTTKDPAFMDLSPVPISITGEVNPLMQFQGDWNKNYYMGTESQHNAVSAAYSPNDGSTYGNVGEY